MDLEWREGSSSQFWHPCDECILLRPRCPGRARLGAGGEAQALGRAMHQESFNVPSSALLR